MNRELIIERSKRLRYDGSYTIDDPRIGRILMALDMYKKNHTWSGTFEVLYNEFLTTAEKMEFECNCNFYRSRDKVIYLIKKYFIKTNNLLNNE
jgi:hypothetical protein